MEYVTWYSCTKCGWTSGAALADDEAKYEAIVHGEETGHTLEERQEPHPAK